MLSWRRVFVMALCVLVVGVGGMITYPIVQNNRWEQLLRICVTVPDQEPSTRLGLDSIQQVAEMLPLFTEDSQLGELASTVQMNLPAYRSLIRQTVGNGEGITVDVLLQLHEWIDPTGCVHVTDQVRASQANILRMLNLKKYDIIAIEGLPFDSSFDVDDLVTWGIDEYMSTAGTYDASSSQIKQIKNQIAEAIWQSCPTNSAIQFVLTRHTYGIGSEDPWLNSLHLEVLDELERQGEALPVDDSLLRMSEVLRKLRSQIALCKLVKQLRAQGVRRGAVVIGVAHFQEMLAQASAMGIRACFYRTCIQ